MFLVEVNGIDFRHITCKNCPQKFDTIRGNDFCSVKCQEEYYRKHGNI